MSKVWFVTGAGSGIGTGIAKAALKAGDRVVAHGRNLERLRTALPAKRRANGSRSSSWTWPTRRRPRRPRWRR